MASLLNDPALIAARKRMQTDTSQAATDAYNQALAQRNPSTTPTQTGKQGLTWSAAPVTSPAQPVVVEPLRTYEQQGRSLIQAGYDKGVKTAGDILPEGEPVFKSIDDAIQSRAENARQQKALKEAQLANQQQVTEQSASQQRNASESQAAATAGQLQGSREGFASGSNVAAADKFKQASQEQVGRIIAQQDIAKKAVDQARADLEYARKSENTQLVNQYQQQLDSATAQAKQIDTEYLAATSAASAEERAAKTSQSAIVQSGVNSFRTLVESGNKMDFKTVQGFAQQFGLPADLLMGYYDGAENIRNDKTLDAAQKEAELANFNYDFNEKIGGIRSKEAQSVSDFSKLAQSGKYDAAQLASFATAMNIPNDQNPLFQLDVKAKELANQKAAAELSGKPTTSAEINARATLLSDLADVGRTLDGNGNVVEIGAPGALNNSTGYLPSTPIDGFQVDMKNGVLNVVTPVDANGRTIPYQCGAGVNRVWGLASGGKGEAGGMGSKIEEKKALVDRNGVKSTDITDPNTQIVPGMAFVMDVGNSTGGNTEAGHTGLIKQNLGGGKFLTAEWNWDNKGGYSEQVRDMSRVYGFANPPAGKAALQSSDPNAIINMSNQQILQMYEQAGVKIDPSNPKAQSIAIANAKKNNYIPGAAKSESAIPEQYSWANTAISNAFGAAEGGKAAERKQQELAKAISGGNGKIAKSIAFNAVVENIPAAERTAFQEALATDTSYNKLKEAYEDFKSAGYKTGLVGSTISEVYKNIDKTSPAEAIRLKAKMATAFNAYRKAITGAGASPKELENLAESMPTFNRNMNDVGVLIDSIRDDARSNLDQKISFSSGGSFDSYDDMQKKLSDLETLGGGNDQGKSSANGVYTRAGVGKGTINSAKHVDVNSIE